MLSTMEGGGALLKMLIGVKFFMSVGGSVSSKMVFLPILNGLQENRVQKHLGNDAL